MSAKLTTTQKVTFLPDINKPGQEQTSPWSRMQKKGKETETAQPAKSQTPTVSKDEIALFRNSVRQNACVEMLRGGFHRSFSELFSLLQRWKEIRLAAGPGSAIWQHKSLEEQPAKLHTLRHYLTKAETALRAGAWSAVYDQQVFLAQYFREPEDRWLSCHFYQTSLNSARRVKIDGGRKEAEALANMGQVYMEQGQLDSAREQYECFYQLTAGRAWRSEGGRSLHCQACEGLWRVYTQLAERPLQANDYRAAIDTLSKAFQMAKEAGDHRIEGEAAYRVGLAYQCVGDQGQYERGCTYFERGYEIARDLEEVPLLQRAQVFVGSARAYSMIRKYSRSVETASHSDLLLLTAWKESRQNVFTDTTGSAEGKI
ncbi:tetratricopeptide repeat protein 29 isoform X2 [Oncorhynchus kisutch]|uniref:tetratricopeptide repeat protein 29 isoform X2 n=1 Tax=Oncorhynchus kisutch TaxID=8019 RepID=UPI0012DDC330|nr:tetratricopeptide repeat protein 29 isoform X2 [Oncorhynchus kisutch]